MGSPSDGAGRTCDRYPANSLSDRVLAQALFLSRLMPIPRGVVRNPGYTVLMIDPLPIPDELWAKVPPDAQAAIAAAFLALRQRVEELETRLGDLEARLKLNSTNSSKPPSSDPIGMKRRPPAPPSGKKRGGQPGHRKARRLLVPSEK